MNDRISNDGDAQSWYRFRGHRYADVERLVTAVLCELPQETERPPRSRVVRALSDQLIRDHWVKDVIDYENIPESKMISGETEDEDETKPWSPYNQATDEETRILRGTPVRRNQDEVRRARLRIAEVPHRARPLVTRDEDSVADEADLDALLNDPSWVMYCIACAWGDHSNCIQQHNLSCDCEHFV